jgi:transposase-like protein
MNDNIPQTLVEAIRYFSDPEVAFNFMVQLRWPDGVKCPHCGNSDVRPIATRKTWECKHCTEKKQFSIRVGTLFEDSALPLEKWLAAIWMLANAKNGVSSYEVHRAIGVTQKTAWFMLQRIRLAMQTGTFEKFAGEIEVVRPLSADGRGTCTPTGTAGAAVARAAPGRPSSWDCWSVAAR